MLTVEELKRFDVFTDLEPADYERIIRAAGDISMKAGEARLSRTRLPSISTTQAPCRAPRRAS